MGLSEYIRAGASLRREIVTLQTDAVGSGSVTLGSAYILLDITTDKPCRIRLYDNESSRDNVGEKNRPFGNTSVSSSIALIGDISMSSIATHTIDPVLYSVVENATNQLTYYKIDNVTSPPYPKITFNAFLMEIPAISTTNRKTLPQLQYSFAANGITSGTLADPVIPQTYLLVSASVTGSSASAVTRLRLYSNSSSLYSPTEISRSFTTESTAVSYLIVDALMSSSQVTYFVPKIIGANLQNAGADLNITRTDRNKMAGNNELYYILQNVSSVSSAVTTSLHVFSLED